VAKVWENCVKIVLATCPGWDHSAFPWMGQRVWWTDRALLAPSLSMPRARIALSLRFYAPTLGT
jgi:hypothetical protein